MKNCISRPVGLAALCQLINVQPAFACLDFSETPGSQIPWAIFLFVVTAITLFVIRRKCRESKVKALSLLALLIVTAIILSALIFFPSIPAVSFAC